MIDRLLAFLSGLWNAAPAVELQPVDVVASIDQGTQSSRVFLYGKDAQAIASSQTTFNQHYPERGCAFCSCRNMCAISMPELRLRFACCRWCEHDPYDILRTVETCMEDAVKVCLSTQAERACVYMLHAQSAPLRCVWPHSTQ